jgi:hypothetical protein
MELDKSTFDYLKPTERQLKLMEYARLHVSGLAKDLNECIPDGPDKTYLMRKLREVGMWANVAITRNPNGSPRKD